MVDRAAREKLKRARSRSLYPAERPTRPALPPPPPAKEFSPRLESGFGDFLYDRAAITDKEARTYVLRYGRLHPRERIQQWLLHCSRIRKRLLAMREYTKQIKNKTQRSNIDRYYGRVHGEPGG